MLRAQGALSRIGVFPSHEKVMAMPAEKRLAMGPGKGLVGALAPVDTEDHVVPTRDGGSIRVRVYRSTSATDQPVLYTHGGGFVVGGIRSCDHVCRRLAFETGAVVFSVEYRLAPEHRFPGPLHDALDALDWALASFDVDPSLLVVAGDSGGGNLAAAAAVVLRDQRRPLAGQLLIYPAVDLSLSLPGIHAYRGYGLDADDCRTCANAYLGDHDPTDPYASPWYAEPVGLAPALVITVTHDCLQHEGIAYAEKLRDAGVSVKHVDVADHVHGSLSVPTLYRGIDELYAEMSAFVKGVATVTA